jgi:hypothetical protein
MRLVKVISTDRNRPIDFIEITMRSDYQEAIQILRKKYNISEDGYDPDEDQSFVDFLNSNELKTDIAIILKELELSNSWKNAVLENVVLGIYYDSDTKSGDILKDRDGLIILANTDDLSEIKIVVGLNAKKEDFDKAWSVLDHLRKGLRKKRTKARPMFERDLKIYQWAMSGMTIAQIKLKLEEAFPELPIVDDFTEDRITDGNIRKIVATYCDKFKIPKERRPKMLGS